jgi:hypothetical protein
MLKLLTTLYKVNIALIMLKLLTTPLQGKYCSDNVKTIDFSFTR